MSSEQLSAAVAAFRQVLDLIAPIHPCDREAIFREARSPGTSGTAIPGDGTDAATVVRALTAAAETLQAQSANVFRLDGQVWTLTFRGRTARVPTRKGLQNLHTLLSNPGTDIHVADLIDPQNIGEARSHHFLGSDAVLDERAKHDYWNRITELDDAIQQAVDDNRDERAAALDRERAELIDELQRATGLGGRPRQLDNPTERARKAVYERIRDTLHRLDDQHPELAMHLRATVTTGTQCSYQPIETFAWTLR